MNQKVLIKEVLKYWYFIDSVLLNGHAKKVITDQKDYNEYISVKGALLNNLYELYKYIEYNPKNIEVPKNDKILQEQAVQLAKRSKSISANMIQDKKFVDHMKKIIIKESQNSKIDNIKELTENIINTRFLKMSLDNILVGVPLIEANNPIKDFKSEILEETYLMMRSNLIEISKKYNKDFFLNEGLKKNVTEIAVMDTFHGLISVLGFKLQSAAARGIEIFVNRCQNKCGSLKTNITNKKICILNCKIQTHQKIIASLRQVAAQTNNEKVRDKFAKDVRRAQMKIGKYQRQLIQLKARAPMAEENETIQTRIL